MSQATVSVRMDERLKEKLFEICEELGVPVSVMFTALAKKVTREKRLPFEISVDPFYSESNLNELKKRISDVKTGKSTLKEHDLIEVDE